jgi:hypothetical protein
MRSRVSSDFVAGELSSDSIAFGKPPMPAPITINAAAPNSRNSVV